MLSAAAKAGLRPLALRERFPRRAEIPFDPAAKMMATQHEGAGEPRVFVKGAPELVVDLCRCGEAQEGELNGALRAAAERLASRALRVLAVATVPDAAIDGAQGFRALRGRGVLLGLIGQLDPPREEVEEAVRACRRAGIRTVMVTGDHKHTACAVARSLDIAREGDIALDGPELEQLSDADLDARLERASVFARVHPAHKLRIVEAFQRRGDVVAMTGDGVNDAPALVRADVGVAMGITGTEVAKQAARIVVTDDNFATIVAAVEEGRLVYQNLKKVIFYLMSTSIPAVIVLLGALVLGGAPPLAAVQILWINLVTEGVVTVNLIMEPAEGDEMRRRPVSRGEPLLGREALRRAAVIVPVIAISILGWFLARTALGVPLREARTETFALLAVCAWFNVLNCRSESRSAFSLDVLRNPWLVSGLVIGNALQLAVIYWGPLRELFHTEPIELREFVWIGLVGSCVLWAEELRKWWRRRGERPPLAPA
jgi:Ca2+-transporting ATPase